MTALAAALSSRPYPGRGCVAARVGDGSLWLGYFLTGRSEASRARALELRPGGEVEVVGTSGCGGGDPLRHYRALVRRNGWTVVGNGDQVEPLATALVGGAGLAAAWAAHTYEPDPPIYTPRIWMTHELTADRVVVGSVRRSDGTNGEPDRGTWQLSDLHAGAGVLITTYAGTVQQVLPSALPVYVEVSVPTGRDLLAYVWESLDPSLRVAALAARPDGLLFTTP